MREDVLGLNETQPWRADAACVEVDDPSIFFPERGMSAEPAKAVCQSCLVRHECLEFALREEIDFGIWGGVPERKRRQLRRQRTLAEAALA